MKKTIFIFFIFYIFFTNAQIIKGKITNTNNKPIPFTNIVINGTNKGVTSDEKGNYTLQTPKDNIILIVSSIGFISQRRKIYIKKNETKTINFKLRENTQYIDEVIVTGTRTDKIRTNSAVIVNVINSAALDNVQACNLSEGLKFQTGLRVETDCQTCNYTQLRMNGLAGGYSQILINGRPIFSPLTGLYGLEQIPTNMISRIEVVRGGGSALYGSSAIGGTINVITKIPKKNNYSIGYLFQNTKGTTDNIIAGNATLINEQKNAGASFFINNRHRNIFDSNNDNFSEFPELKNNSFGSNLFFLPTEDQKIEINFSKINEYRYGGEIINKEPHFAMQAEERIHDIYMGNIDYQINFNDDNSSLITYFAMQSTDRNHYTGIRPKKGTIEDDKHLRNPPYGTSETITLQGGVQLNHKINNFIKGTNTITIGSEYVQDDIFDIIPTFNYNINQLSQDYGFFFQSDWKITEKLNLLSGVRFDNNILYNKVNKNKIINNVFSPRFSLLFKPFKNTQIRGTWGTGFRAPQAFDSDLHIAFAGGGVSRIQLNPKLKKESSNSYSLSFNYDKPTEHYIYGFTIESFYTKLDNVFIQENIGTDKHGEIFEKRNGESATVQGITLEARLNYDGIIQLESGLTFQNSKNKNPVLYSDALKPKRNFLRTPNNYGYASLTYTPNQKFKTTVNLVYTGSMELLHIGSVKPNILKDEYFSSPKFTNVGFKSSYNFNISKLNTTIQFSAGMKNIFDNYQSNFDKGKERDSNFIYGPSIPRTFFIGIKFIN